MEHDIIPQPSPEVVLEEIDGEYVLFYPSRDKAVYVSETGALVWQLCDNKRSVFEIISLLEQAYPESDSVCGDVEWTLRELAGMRALHIGSAG